MKRRSMYTLLLAIVFSTQNFAQTTAKEPWRPDQLISPLTLASVINDPKAAKPVIFCIGPGASIKGSVNIGPGNNRANMEKLQQQLKKLPKDKSIVIYCGCCPFANCPNIRPAFTLLNEMKFTNHQLLDIPKNIKVDWIDKGFPQAR